MTEDQNHFETGRSKGELREMVRKKEEEVEQLQKKLDRQVHNFQEIWDLANNIHAHSMEDREIERFYRLIQNMVTGHFGLKNVGLFHKDFSEWNSYIWETYSGEEKSEIYSFSDEDPEYDVFSERYEIIPIEALEEKPSIREFYEICLDRSIEIALPLVLEGEEEYETMQGLLLLGEKLSGASISASEKQFLELLGRMFAISLQNAELHRRSITDSLTGLFGRGHFNLRMDQEIARMKRMEEDQEKEKAWQDIAFSLLLLDIDHFKEINDTYGHPVGDRILQRLSHILKQSVREADVVARYGGEEFAVILPEATEEVSYRTGERLRERIEEEEFKVGSFNKTISVTVSGGVSSYPNDGESPQELIQKADEALYKAKQEGRNQIIHYQDLE